MKEKTTAAIAALYQAFSDAPKPHFVDGCPCCIERKEIGVLLSKPLRDVTANELSNYASSLFLTVGCEADFRYFLPRIFELSAVDPGWWPDPEVAIGKLSYVEWKTWSKAKTLAIESYLDALFEEFIESGSDEADIWLCALALSQYGIQRYLDRLKRAPKGLISVYESNSNSLLKDKLSNGFWNDAPAERKEVINWFKSDEVKKLIDAAYAAIYNPSAPSPKSPQS